MPERPDFKATGGRLSGEDMRGYMESYADRFLKNAIRYNVEVTAVRRIADASKASNWAVTCTDKLSGTQEELRFDKVVLCTGVSSISIYAILKYDLHIYAERGLANRSFRKTSHLLPPRMAHSMV